MDSSAIDKPIIRSTSKPGSTTQLLSAAWCTFWSDPIEETKYIGGSESLPSISIVISDQKCSFEMFQYNMNNNERLQVKAFVLISSQMRSGFHEESFIMRNRMLRKNNDFPTHGVHSIPNQLTPLLILCISNWNTLYSTCAQTNFESALEAAANSNHLPELGTH